MLLPPLAANVSPAALLEIARGLAADRAKWLARVEHHPDERWFERVSGGPDHDVWLIGWDSFQGVELHDHGGAAGALYVVEGELLETAASRRSPSRLAVQSLRAGTVRAFGPDHVHRVVNPSARPATSLHLYSPPLETMDFYRPAGGRGFEHVHTEAALAPRSGPGEIR